MTKASPKRVRRLLESIGDPELLLAFDRAVLYQKTEEETRKRARVTKFLALPQVQTKSQAERGTRVYKTRRGLYSVNRAVRSPVFCARFWPYVRGRNEVLARSADQRLLGKFPTFNEAADRCAEHLERNGRKPLQGCSWCHRLMKRTPQGWSWKRS